MTGVDPSTLVSVVADGGCFVFGAVGHVWGGVASLVLGLLSRALGRLGDGVFAFEGGRFDFFDCACPLRASSVAAAST